MIIYPGNQSKIIQFEEFSLNAWPAITELHHHGCVLRFSNGYTKRANSVNALYFNENINELIDYAENIYSKYSLPTIFKILKHKKYENLDSVLEEKGYSIIDNTNVKIVDLRTHNFTTNNEVEISNSFSKEWINDFIIANKLESKVDSVNQVLMKISVDKMVASVKINNKIIGFGFGTIENNIVGIFDIFITEKYRNLGYSKKIMNKILFESKKRSMIYCYLQVVKDNIIANKLYQSLGFKAYYNYWYRVKPNK